MTILITLNTSSPWHYAAHGGRLCAFTANRLGYRTLLKWAGEIARGEDIAFAVPDLRGFGRLCADWLSRAGQRVVWVSVG